MVGENLATGAAEREIRPTYEELAQDYQRRTVALASAAHELKTPLSIMSGYIDLLLSQKQGPLNEAQKQALIEMQTSRRRLQHFIDDFLTYSALETGKLQLRLEVGDLNQCLAELCNIWTSRYQEKGIAIYFLPAENLPSFQFDYHKLQHAASNLVHNAWKFTPAGGTVWITTEQRTWERRIRQEPNVGSDRRRKSAKAPEAVYVTVADTGPGIAPEFHQEVFDDFCKAPHPEPGIEGMGLGLAIARRLVTSHGGRIWVENQPEAGSKFCFLIPIAGKAAAAAAGTI